MDAAREADAPPVRLGLLGTGRGYHFARALRWAQGAVLAGVCGRDPDKTRARVAKWGTDAPVFDSYEHMLDADLDAVIVASPMPLHVDHAVAALRASKHVLSEVSAADTIEDCHRLLEAVRASDRTYMLAENFCYMRPWALVKALAHAGRLGEAYYGQGLLQARIRFDPPGPNARWTTASWAMQPGHPYATHYLGPLYQVFGERVARVVCLGSGQHHQAWARADDTSVVLCETASGRLIELRVDFFGPAPMQGSIDVYGTQGACRVLSTGTHADQQVHLTGASPKNAWENLYAYADHLPDRYRRLPAEVTERTFDSGLPVLLEEFAHAVRTRARPPIDVTDALHMSAPGIVAAESRRRGGAPVDVPAFESSE